MSFELNPVAGNSTEIITNLKELPQHEREERVIPVIKQAIADIVEELGGYLSVSCKGNLNPVAGETGELVEIYITSLPRPQSVPAPVIEDPNLLNPENKSNEQIEKEAQENIEQSQQQENALGSEQSVDISSVPPVITENVPGTIEPVMAENAAENPSALPVDSSAPADPAV
jgi:hypothetical protein